MDRVAANSRTIINIINWKAVATDRTGWRKALREGQDPPPGYSVNQVDKCIKDCPRVPRHAYDIKLPSSPNIRAVAKNNQGDPQPRISQGSLGKVLNALL